MIFLFSIDKIWVETNFAFPSKAIHSSKFNKPCLHERSNRENVKLGNRDIKKMKREIDFSTPSTFLLIVAKILRKELDVTPAAHAQ